MSFLFLNPAPPTPSEALPIPICAVNPGTSCVPISLHATSVTAGCRPSSVTYRSHSARALHGGNVRPNADAIASADCAILSASGAALCVSAFGHGSVLPSSRHRADTSAEYPRYGTSPSRAHRLKSPG